MALEGTGRERKHTISIGDDLRNALDATDLHLSDSGHLAQRLSIAMVRFMTASSERPVTKDLSRVNAPTRDGPLTDIRKRRDRSTTSACLLPATARATANRRRVGRSIWGAGPHASARRSGW